MIMNAPHEDETTSPNGSAGKHARPAFLLLALLCPLVGCGPQPTPPAAAPPLSPRTAMWVDLTWGEPIAYDDLLKDLATARVIFLGERHTLPRHHALQAKIIGDLAARGTALAVGMEQLESFNQPAVDAYNRGEISFEQLAERSQWAKRWSGYEQYRPVVEAARAAKAPVLALNARAETIRQVARSGGLAKMDATLRKELPADVRLDDPEYEALLRTLMLVHAAATPEYLRPMIEAQIARDEAMADAVAEFLNSPAGRGRTVVVLCGSGHVAYGLGTPARVRRRLADLPQRIVVMSDSGDTKLTPAERDASRPVTISHEQMRAVNRPIGDYLHVTEPARP